MAFSRWLQKINVAEIIEDEFNHSPQLKQILRKCFQVVLGVVMAVAMSAVPIQTVNATPKIEFIDSGQALGNSISQAVSLADVDGDGDVDAFVANYNNQSNKVWLNDGSGNFTDSQQALGNSNSLGVSLADVDGDGNVDAFITNYNNQSNKVWLNDGSGNFTDSQQALGNSASQAVSLADVDGDGDVDAFVANNGPNKVWLNNGRGKFTGLQQAFRNSNSVDVNLADVDGDGDVDAFVANNGPNKVWLNDGRGNFTDSQQALGNSASQAVSLADVDGDGDVDAFVTNNGPNKVWLNDSRGNFTESQQAFWNSKSRDISVADVDGDGDIDAFVTNYQAKKVWLNDGKGNFTESQQVFGNSKSYSVSLADVDGDNDIDAFVTNWRQPNKVWLNTLDVLKKQACDNIAPANLVVNGSFEKPGVSSYNFETSIEGWEVATGPVIELNNDNMFVYYGNKYFQAHDGSQFVDLDSLGDQGYGKTTTKISQKIPTQPGDIYKLTFAFTGSGKTTEDDKLNVHWGEELVAELDKLGSDTIWEMKTYNLEAKSTETVLSFDNLNETADGYGTRLDGVSVNLCQ